MFAHFSEAALKCDIVGKGDNYKYPVQLYTHHFRERFTFSVFIFCKSVFGQFTTCSSSFHSFSATWCGYYHVEVKENQQNVGVFSFHFSSSNLFLYQFSICS